MKKFIAVLLLSMMASIASAAPAYLAKKIDVPGGYYLVFSNPTAGASYCRVDTSLGQWATFNIGAGYNHWVAFAGPSTFKWKCS